MARWLVTQNDMQFGVDDLNQLKQMAADGRLSPADMVQPPGATEWLYANEIPELKGLLRDRPVDDFDRPKGPSTAVTLGIVGGLIGVFLLGGIAMLIAYGWVSSGNETLVGEGGKLAYSQMLVTQEGAPLRADHSEAAATVASLPKDSTIDLLSKRGEFYRARTASGQEGWIRVDQVLPMYQLGGGAVREEYDPLYNPDRYVEVSNAAWMLLDDKSGQLTVFRFQLTNNSKYPMTDLKLLATVKDGKGNELEKVEFGIEGTIPPQSATMVGTLAPEDARRKGQPDFSAEGRRLLTEFSFQELAKEDAELQLRYSDGVEVGMKSKDFATAQIDLLEVRAIPDDKHQN